MAYRLKPSPHFFKAALKEFGIPQPPCRPMMAFLSIIFDRLIPHDNSYMLLKLEITDCNFRFLYSTCLRSQFVISNNFPRHIHCPESDTFLKDCTKSSIFLPYIFSPLRRYLIFTHVHARSLSCYLKQPLFMPFPYSYSRKRSVIERFLTVFL